MTCTACGGRGEITITETVNGQDTVRNIDCGVCRGAGEVNLPKK